jgi:hypothetical protein
MKYITTITELYEMKGISSKKDKGKLFCIINGDSNCVVEFSIAPKNKFFEGLKKFLKGKSIRITIEDVNDVKTLNSN